MEIRRRKKKRPRSPLSGRTAYARGANETGGGFLSAVLILLVIAALVYVAVSTPVGEEVLKKLGVGKALPSPPPTAAPLEGTSAPAVPDASEEHMQFPALEAYAVEIGRYASPEAAGALVASIRRLGAAGFVLGNGDGVSILTSVYSTEAAAESVAAKLGSAGYTCAILPLKCDALDFDAHSSEERLEALRRTVGFCRSLIDELGEEALRFDTEERSVEYGKAITGELLTNIRSARAAISDIVDMDGVVKLIDGYLAGVADDAEKLVQSKTADRVEFSGLLKNLEIGALTKYISLIGAVRAAGG